MKILPVGEALVVEPVQSERVTPGGIVIPDSDARKRDLASVKAKVVAIGPLAFEAEKTHEKTFGCSVRIPAVGETILMGKYAGYNLEIGDRKVRVIWDKDVAAVLESENE
jgi:chaperonin GroES